MTNWSGSKVVNFTWVRICSKVIRWFENKEIKFYYCNHVCRGREDDDKWKHDLFERDESRISNGRVGSQDLRLKLQRKGSQHGSRSVRGSVSGGVRDLREKLSGITAQPMDIEPPRRKQKTVTEVSKLSRRSVIEAPVSETKRVASTGETIDSFLESLGLEKYSITFQAEEVDMTALVHMNDEDLKAMSIPMV
ncbi:hypothetical protein Leryth_022441 [Lithospermum erythrorhizon]|nr:hypothetical protein Leryth_022441 [Lithospermum erythrorhizon]